MASQRSTATGSLIPLGSSPALSLVAAPDGSGSMALSPGGWVPSLPVTLTFSYTAAAGGLFNGQLTLTAPTGWSPPSSASGSPGYTTASTGTVSTSGQTITVAGVSLVSGATLNVIYGSGGGTNRAQGPIPTAGATFSAAERSSASGTSTGLAASPTLALVQYPINSAVPAVGGLVGDGLSLTASAGTWVNTPASYSYAWQRCDSSGANCAPIAGASASSYTIQPADAAKTLEVVVTASNPYGSSSATSAPTGTVPAVGACPVSGASDIWTGGAGSVNWADNANWSTGASPTSNDFACLPVDTTGTGAITVPAINVKQLVTFKPLTLTNGLSTANGADLEANTTWQGGTLGGPTLAIGVGTTVTMTGQVTLSSNVSVSNLGTVQVVNGGGVTGGYAPSWLNSGTVSFADTTGASFFMYYGRFVNEPGGTVVKTGTAANDSVFGYGVVENDGAVVSQAGVLGWWSYQSSTPGQQEPDGVSDGSFGGTGSGHVQLGAYGGYYNRVSAQTTFGNNVWVVGSLYGTVALPAGVTLNVGDDPSTPNTNESGTIYSPVSGAGTLNAVYNSTIAADLNVANVQMAGGSSIASKPDGTPLAIGAGTTVTMTATPSLGSGLHLDNYGTLDFDSNNYFNGSCCFTFVNEPAGTNTPPGMMVLRNNDGNFTDTFTVNSGSLDNEGLFRIEGRLPGVAIKFGSGATLFGAGKGKAEVGDLSQPDWINSLQSNSILTNLASSIGTGWDTLGARAGMAAAASLGNIGVGSCVNANLSIGVVVGAVGVCLVVAPDGSAGVAVTLSGSAGSEFSDSGWNLGDLVHGPALTFDAGLMAAWNYAPDGETKSFSLSDLNGLGWCESMSLTVDVGIAGSHCWGPTPDVPFGLGTNTTTRPGSHTGYLGVSTGEGGGYYSTMSYSVLFECQNWYSLSGHMCPPANRSVPGISGTPTVGQILSTDRGSWTLNPTSYTYQWYDCTSADPKSCNLPINGATSTSYILVAADKNDWVTVKVSATNAGGTGSVYATPVGAVS